MTIGIGMGLWRGRVQPLYARDAAAYRLKVFNQSGVWIEESVMQDIRAFAKGLYALRGKRVDFWPLRSGQNVGTGSTVYSFHGKVGTLVNGAAWGVTGVDLSVPEYTGAYIDFGECTPEVSTLSYAANELNIAVDYKATLGAFGPSYETSQDGGQSFYLFSPGGQSSVKRIEVRTVGIPTQYSTPTISTVGTRFCTATAIEGNLELTVDGTSVVGSTVGFARPFTQLLFGARQALLSGQSPWDYNFRGTVYFALSSDALIDKSDLRSLYKSTIGKGLGLA